MAEATTDVTSDDWVSDEARLLASIDARLARLEEKLARWEPIIEDVLRRTEGPRFWRNRAGKPG